MVSTDGSAWLSWAWSLGTVFGSNPGVLAITWTAPVAGSIATAAPGRPVPSSRSVASRWAEASSVVTMLLPWRCWPRIWSMIETNSFSSPVSVVFSARSKPLVPSVMKL